MVCNRCVIVVKQELEKLKLLPALVSMGEVELSKPATDKQLQSLNERLNELGFELLDNQKQKQIEKISGERKKLNERIGINLKKYFWNEFACHQNNERRKRSLN